MHFIHLSEYFYHLLTDQSIPTELKGGAGRETVLLIFQPSHFIVYLL